MTMENLIQTYDDPHALAVENYPEPVREGDCQMPIYLRVDYRARTVDVTHRNFHFAPPDEAEYANLVDLFELPPDTDATRLRAFVDDVVLPLLDRVLAGFEDGFDGLDNPVAVFTDDADAARIEIMARFDDLPRAPCLSWWPADAWFVDCPAGLAADTPDADLRALAARLAADDARIEHVRIVGGLDAVVRCFEQYRARLREDA